VRLSIRDMRLALAHGPGTAGTAQWEARGQGQFRWWIADTPATGLTLWLDYMVVDRADRREPHRYEVPLLKTRPHFGGVRYWFGCPQCAGRVGALYLPAGARRFACRHCLSLVYRSQQAHDKFLDPYRRHGPGDTLGDARPP
jgi:hypothetical protein